MALLKPIKKQCVICGKNFFTTTPTKTICSEECRKERNRRLHYNWTHGELVNPVPGFTIKSTKRCLYCHHKFKARARTHKYCSPACSRAYWLRLSSQKAWGAKWHAQRKCEMCDNLYLPLKFNQRFCHTKCKDKKMGIIKTTRRIYSWRVERACATCGELFIPRIRRQLYCCSSCGVRNPINRMKSYKNTRKWRKKNPERVIEMQRRRRENKTPEQRAREKRMSNKRSKEVYYAYRAVRQLGLI